MAKKSRDLFVPVVPAGKLDRLFTQASSGPRHGAARELMNRIFENFVDVDGSFVREFQTTGFSPRLFELALFAYLEEQDLPLDRSAPAPDFVIRGDHPVAIEVTTTNPSQAALAGAPSTPSWLPDDLETADQEFVFQLGKALRRKLTHRDAQDRAYWELPHVEGIPFVIAVGAFHNDHAQLHPDALLARYLYGLDQSFSHDEAGNLTIAQQELVEHRWSAKPKPLPSGLFKQPEAAHLAGVLFSNSHTIAKFNRIGIEQGLGNDETALVRFGTCYDYTPNSASPSEFAYVVGERPGEQEDFAEGLTLFINPWAATPLVPEALPKIVTTAPRDSDGLLESTFPAGFRPFSSKTMVFPGPHSIVFARYFQRDQLGLLKPGSPSFAELMQRMADDFEEPA
ncbi:hypothetical protein SAMN05421837_103820 [Amycolatopsis pretoriensis]|uniref:Glycosaminoglycan attachment site n=1 Tax=Amycolatopsis pretoriensis TaxID=218821 RepID=A0A1H5QMN9_9PSEU|nr:hypothetical protein [Amycolatopsis pretoriensis]SEF27413.1 hypothetical protein SAMN05421837_103820 [Amycolatopsis pretoriensis]